MPATLRIILNFIKRNLHWLGSLLAVLALFFVGIRLHSYWLALDTTLLRPTLIFFTLLLAMIYAANNIWLAMAWKNILLGLKLDVTNKWAIKVYGLSQIGKYLPGNIFHLAGRQALGMAAGLDKKKLLQSTFLELATISIAGISFACLILPLLFSSISNIFSFLLFSFLVILILYLIKIIFNFNQVKAFIYQFIFLLLSSFIFTFIVLTINQQHLYNFSYSLILITYIASSYTIAWLAGLVMPGAPAGIGIREFVILLLLKNIIPEADLLLAILLGRIITVTGDILFFIFSFFNKYKISN